MVCLLEATPHIRCPVAETGWGGDGKEKGEDWNENDVVTKSLEPYVVSVDLPNNSNNPK